MLVFFSTNQSLPSSHRNVTCSRHDIAEKCLICCYIVLTFTHLLPYSYTKQPHHDPVYKTVVYFSCHSEIWSIVSILILFSC